MELVFCDPDVEQLLLDVDRERERLVAQYRAHVIDWPDDPEIAIVVDRLRHDVPAFRALWDRHDVGPFSSTARSFDHPRSEWRVLDHHRLAVLDQPGMQLVVYTTAGESSDPE